MQTTTLPARLTALSAMVLALSSALRAADAQEFLSASGQDLQWWRAAKFGVFICWGPCSLVAQEIGWSRHGPRPGHRTQHAAGGVPLAEYDELYKRFDPDKFDPREWAGIIKDAGAKYIIFLTKHHDGFCMFDTALTDYKVTNTPFGRDVTAELADACHDAGIRIFWYYSQPDWHHPDYRTEKHATYIEYLHGQIRELCTKYGTIAGIWFDGLGGKATDWDSPTLFKIIRTLQPGALINNRAGLRGDFDTPEQTVGRFQLERPWESCITMSAGWSWRGADKQVKSLKECLHLLIRCAGGGGNLALDTGPMPDGRIDPRQAQRYRQMGAWLRQYGQSIYGTIGGPYRPDQWGVSTRKGNTVYLHVLNWEQDRLDLLPLGKRVLSNTVLTGGTADVEQTPGNLAITLPAQFRDDIDTVIALKLDGAANDILPLSMLNLHSLTLGKPSKASGIWSPAYDAAKAFDGDEDTRWGGLPNSRSGWLEIDLGTEQTFDRVHILESPWNRVLKFQLQARKDGEWVTFHEGTRLSEFRLAFEPVTARYVRLNILEANEVPTLWEFHLYPPQTGKQQ